MGTYDKGILGGFRGKIGTVVGSKWKGIEYMKSKMGKRTKAASPAQLEQQAKFAMLIRFVTSIGKLLMKTFGGFAVNKTGTNSAFAYNFENAIIGIYPDFSLDYAKVLISKGQLHNANNVTATAAGGGIVQFNWIDNSGVAMANATDRSVLVAYCPELKRAVYIENGAARNAGTSTLNAGIFTGKTVETWVGFISADGTEVATSVYTGPVIVL